MRFSWVTVKSGDGKQFTSRILNISENHAVLLSEHVLPAGMACTVQENIPAHKERKPNNADLQAEVCEVIFSPAGIHLHLKIKSLNDEAKRLINSK